MEKVCKKCGNYFGSDADKYCSYCGGKTADLDKERKAFQTNINGWIYFIVNTIILLSLILHRTEKIEYIFLILGELLIWSMLIREKYHLYSASEKLAFIVFIDVILMFISASDIWRVTMSGSAVSGLSNNILRWIFCVFAGIICFILSNKKKNIVFQWAALEFLGLIFPFTWGWRIGHWSNYLKLFFLIYTILNFVWCCIIRTAIIVRAEKIAAKKAMSLGLFTLIVFLRFFCVGVMENYVVSFPQKITSFLTVNLSIKRMILILLVLFIASLLLGAADLKRCGCDALVMSGIACFIIVLKATTVFYIPFGFVAMMVYGFIFLNLLKKEKRGVQGYAVNRAVILSIITLSIVVSLYLISIGLWTVVLAGLIFIKIAIPKAGEKIKKQFICVIMVWIITEAVLAIWQLRLHAETYMTVVVISVSFFIMLRFITWKHPSVTIKYKVLKIAMCVVFAVFLFIPIVKNGTEIKFTYDKDSNQVSFDVKAKGKENYIAEATYYWTNDVLFMGNPETGGADTQNVMQTNFGVNALDVSGGCLVVKTVDKNGVMTEKKAYVPSFYYILDGE